NILDSCRGFPHNFWAVTGLFAIFLLLLLLLYATRSITGRARWLRPNAALTTNPLLSKGDPWLTLSVNVPARKTQDRSSTSAKSEARSWNKLRSTRRWVQSSSCSKTERPSASILIPASLSSLNCQTLKLETGEVSNAGRSFTVNRPRKNGRNSDSITPTDEP